MPVYTWSVDSMRSKPSESGLPNIVSNVNWRLTGAQDGYEAAATGIIDILFDSATYVPYEDLTQDMVIVWVKTALGDDGAGAEAYIAEQLNILINPPIVTLPLPWPSAVA